LLALATSNLQGLGSNLNLNSLPLGSTVGGGVAPAAAGLLSPFPAAINQNLIFPAAPTLQAYTTTSTYVTRLTTTAVVTVPLLFGNKPFSTTITRTKTYDLTTSEVKTLTSTIQPTVVTASQINPTSVSDASSNVKPTTSSINNKPEYEEYEEDIQYNNDVQDDRRTAAATTTTGNAKSKSKYVSQDTAENVGIPDAVPAKPSKSRGGTISPTQKSRKTFVRQSTTASTPTTGSSSRSQSKKEDASSRKRYQAQPVEEDYYSPSYGSTSNSRGSQQYKSKGSNKDKATGTEDSQFYQRQYGTIQDDDVPVDEDPAAAQYPDEESYYARRLKRGEQFGDDEDDDHYSENTKLDREFLLEPSSDGDYSGNYHKYEKCPPIPADAAATTVTVTSTETKTITKFLKGQTASATASVHNNYYGDGGYTSATSSSKTFIPSSGGLSASGRSRGSFKGRNRDSDAAASTVAATSPASKYESRRSYSNRGNAAATTTTEKATSPQTGDRRAQILRRGKSRYNSNQDYDARG
jgi:hypothetical protein